MNEAVLCECQHEFFKIRCIYNTVLIALCSECVGYDRLNLHFQSRWYMRRSVNSSYISN